MLQNFLIQRIEDMWSEETCLNDDEDENMLQIPDLDV